MKNFDMGIMIFGLIIEISGLWLFGYKVNWWAAFALFLTMWSANISVTQKIKRAFRAKEMMKERKAA